MPTRHQGALPRDHQIARPLTPLFAPEVVGPTVDLLAELAGDGAALEFAIGTGRVAIPSPTGLSRWRESATRIELGYGALQSLAARLSGACRE
jgi:hypothetical protein